MSILRYQGGCVSGTHAIPVREVKCGACDEAAVAVFIINDTYELGACATHAEYLLNPDTTLDGEHFTIRREQPE